MLAWLAVLPGPASADPDDSSGNDTAPESLYEMKHLIELTQEPTYITLGGGLNYGGEGRFSNQIFEANLKQSFHWMDNPQALQAKGYNGFLTVDMKLRLRMLSSYSAPVRTPSFMPRLLYYFWLDDQVPEASDKIYYSLMLSHHSNGQEGAFYNPDGTLNTKSGNFSTNYLQLAYYRLWGERHEPDWSSFSLDWHPGFGREKGLKGQYEELKLNYTMRTGALEVAGYLDRGTLTNQSAISYTLLGRRWVVAPNAKAPNIPPVKTKPWDNIQFSTAFNYRVPGWEDIRLYLKYDYGYDYYNIHFRERLNRIQFGFSGDSFQMGSGAAACSGRIDDDNCAHNE